MLIEGHGLNLIRLVVVGGSRAECLSVQNLGAGLSDVVSGFKKEEFVEFTYRLFLIAANCRPSRLLCK